MVTRRTVSALSVSIMLAATLTGTAVADPDDYPSEQDIEDAREAEGAAESAVEEAEEHLADLERELDELHIAAGLAVEAYNGAKVALAEAQSEAEETSAYAEQVAAEAELAHDDLGRLAAASYRNGGSLAAWAQVFQAQERDEFVNRSANWETATRSQGELSDRWQDASVEARQAAADAEIARAELAQAEEDAEQAAIAAKGAIAQHEEALATAEAQREELLVVLADAQGTTVELERERRAGVEEEARRQREEEEQRRADEEAAQAAAEEESDTEAAESPAPSPSPSPSPPPDPAPEPSSGADRAVEYAKAQLGKPYEWGADGPDTFDCSGLTMRAWEAGGVSLTHHSVAQANETSRVSYADLQPGDLIFWSNNDAPSGVFHVALYIGDGKMIHAPATGKTVEIQDVFYWTTPSFYGRV